MFETAELGHTIDKKSYAARVPRLRGELLDLQAELFERKSFSLLVLVNGLDGAGKGETIHLLNDWMDPRHIVSLGFEEPTGADAARPWMWRFWSALPPRGKIAAFVGSWYHDLIGHAPKRMKKGLIEHRFEQIKEFERMLTEENVVLLKLFFHLSKEQQRKRLKELRKSPLTRWRVTDADLERYRRYDEFRSAADWALRETSTGYAPWTIIEGYDERYRNLTVGNAVRDLLRSRLQSEAPKTTVAMAPPAAPRLAAKSILDALDLKQRLTDKEYDKQLELWQSKLNGLLRTSKFQKRSVVLAFEGWDAAGKGGAIRRVTTAIDARRYQVIPIAAPTDEERARPYLWRFWKHMPACGHFTVFDRTWYGRVLVERVEHLADEAAWQRAYSEINEFEEQLVEAGTVVVKLWLHIDADEQERRFKERQKTGFKRYKITDEDWRNRKKRPAYEVAVCDMVERTSTELAPWTLVEANDKRFARVKVLKTVVSAIEAAL
jgi:polyphosphate:AMP phosphotransferase